MDYDSQRSYEIRSEVDMDSAGTQQVSSRRSDIGIAPIVPVVLSGGGGSRLWPFSTSDTPKQFLPLTGATSLFQQALIRIRDRTSFAAPMVVASARHAELCERELKVDGPHARLILEPVARNTAAAVAMAAAAVRDMHGGDALLLIMPSDHLIDDVDAFHRAVKIGEQAARAGRLVTFGINPSSADTGYGYLEVGVQIDDVPGANAVATFVEKPPLDLAEQMVAGGRHLWNAGIFLFRAQILLDEMMVHAPDICRAAVAAVSSRPFEGIRLLADAEALADCPSLSIDYAVMEHSDRVAVVPMSPGWSDLGSWDALASLVGAGDPSGLVTALDCDSCFIRTDGLQVAALGVRDLIIVASGGRLLILPKGRSQEVKRLLSAMDSLAA
ncbi:MAG TPA: sugar phosphate nucleotidyltransferase [Sphingomicrobium sp.]|nr:sugar phosphate nucleotidyltransferase [Sphingomicrobium sp.]